jgi:hypothetical protein
MALKNIEVFVDATPEGEKPKAAETVTLLPRTCGLLAVT